MSSRMSLRAKDMLSSISDEADSPGGGGAGAVDESEVHIIRALFCIPNSQFVQYNAKRFSRQFRGGDMVAPPFHAPPLSCHPCVVFMLQN